MYDQYQYVIVCVCVYVRLCLRQGEETITPNLRNTQFTSSDVSTRTRLVVSGCLHFRV